MSGCGRLRRNWWRHRDNFSHKNSTAEQVVIYAKKRMQVTKESMENTKELISEVSGITRLTLSEEVEKRTVLFRCVNRNTSEFAS